MRHWQLVLSTLLSGFPEHNETGEPRITVGPPEGLEGVGPVPDLLPDPVLRGPFSRQGLPNSRLEHQEVLPLLGGTCYLAQIPIGMSSGSSLAWVYLCDLGEVS